MSKITVLDQDLNYYYDLRGYPHVLSVREMLQLNIEHMNIEHFDEHMSRLHDAFEVSSHSNHENILDATRLKYKQEIYNKIFATADLIRPLIVRESQTMLPKLLSLKLNETEMLRFVAENIPQNNREKHLSLLKSLVPSYMDASEVNLLMIPKENSSVVKRGYSPEFFVQKPREVLSQPPLLINYSSSEGERIISVVAKYPMYRSTGRNSEQKNTFFPFSGIAEIGFGPFYPRGIFMKPVVENPIGPPHYPHALANYVSIHLKEPIQRETVARFGNIEAMVISYHIGGGFWNKPEGQALGTYLQHSFSNYVRQVFELNQESIVRLKNVDNIDTSLIVQYNKDMSDYELKINHQLKEFIIVEFGIPRLREGYSVEDLDEISQNVSEFAQKTGMVA